jgi:hypothetical protein
MICVKLCSASCTLYYLCVDGSVVGEFECGEGLYFDPEVSECNFQDEVECDAPTTPTTSTATPTTSTSKPPPPPLLECTTANSGPYPYPGVCSLYYRCFGTVPVVGECEEGKLFDVNLLECVDASDAVCYE